MNRNKYIIIVLLLLSVLAAFLLSGCGSKSDSTTEAVRKYELLKVTDVVDSDGYAWKIYQLRLQLEGSAKFTIDLKLSGGDKVDCWYKVEKPASGGGVDFQVKAGAQTIYTSVAPGLTAVGNTSDRLDFTATEANGTSYRLIFHNSLADKDSKETIFVEIVYPANDAGEDSIFIPLGID